MRMARTWISSESVQQFGLWEPRRNFKQMPHSLESCRGVTLGSTFHPAFLRWRSALMTRCWPSKVRMRCSSPCLA